MREEKSCVTLFLRIELCRKLSDDDVSYGNKWTNFVSASILIFYSQLHSTHTHTKCIGSNLMTSRWMMIFTTLQENGNMYSTLLFKLIMDSRKAHRSLCDLMRDSRSRGLFFNNLNLLTNCCGVQMSSIDKPEADLVV